MADWYVLQCDARRDQQVESLVAQASVETFNPRIPRTRRRNGHKPLFPGYMFIRLEPEAGNWTAIRYVPGTKRLVEVDGVPCPVEDSIVEAIRRRVAEYAPGSAALRAGDRVKVLSGPFADLEGIFCEHRSGAERVAILIDYMRRQVRLELGADNVEPVYKQGVA